MARWIVGGIVAWFVFMGCARGQKPRFARVSSRLSPDEQPTLETRGELLQPHRFLLECFERVAASGPQPGSVIERDRQALIATFLCLFGHPRRASVRDVARFMMERAVEGMPVGARLRLVEDIGRLWGMRFRSEFGGVLFSRGEMRPGYGGVDGVVFIADGELIAIHFVRFIRHDARSNEL